MDHFDEESYVRWEIGYLFVILRGWKLKLVKINDVWFPLKKWEMKFSLETLMWYKLELT